MPLVLTILDNAFGVVQFTRNSGTAAAGCLCFDLIATQLAGTNGVVLMAGFPGTRMNVPLLASSFEIISIFMSR